jgi:peptide/nickel transport system substrate-binding protein
VRIGLAALILAAVAAGITPAARADGPQHGIAMYGAPALPPDFLHLPQANPDAPQGGRMVLSELGGFDSLNPYILAGRAPWGVQVLTVETLLGRSYDEPFTLYGLLAETVETDAERSFVEFTLRPEARFSDGSPVTVADVMWSFETLGTQGHPRYHAAWRKIAAMEQTGERSLRITFTEPDREMPLILGLRPILQAAQFEGRDFSASTLIPVIGSGPYLVSELEPGRFISFQRNPGWWGRDLPFYRGQHNLHEIRYEYFADEGIAFEAFTSGQIDSWREVRAARWETGYGFPRVRMGEVVLSEIPHARPSGMLGLAFNTRRAIFADWRVREALIHAFNFEFVNLTVNAGRVPRIASYFGNSELGMGTGPADEAVRAALAPFADTLLPDALEAYALPVSDGSEANRAGIRTATRLLEQAGWQVRDGVLRDAEGRAFEFEILLEQGQGELRAVSDIYVEALRRLGIRARVTVIDAPQYRERINGYDFDMTRLALSLSLSPGNEQWLYFGSDGVETPGTRNLAGIESPAAEAMIGRLLTSEAREDFVTAARALDRVLTTGRYVIPLWFQDRSRLAHVARLRYPSETLPIYGDWLGFQPELWWSEE